MRGAFMKALVIRFHSMLHSFGAKYLGLLLLLFAISSSTQAQVQVEGDAEMPVEPQAPLHFQHLGVADGLNQGTVYDIHQDSSGFMWFGTQAGLNRYDGYNVKTYSTDPFDSTSFQGSWARVIEEDNKGNLWIGTSQRGISRFNPTTSTFKRYPYSEQDSAGATPTFIFDIMEGDSGTIWMTSLRGLLTKLNPQTGEIKRNVLTVENSELPVATGKMHQDSSGSIWIGGVNALYRYDPQTGRDTLYRFDPKEKVTNSTGEPIRNSATTIIPDPNNRDIIWITSIGLIRFNKQTGEHTRYLPNPSNPKDIESNATYEIVVDRQRTNIFWVTTWQSGLLHFNTETKQFIRYQHHSDIPNSLISDNLLSIYADRSGMIWTGTNDAKGVNRFDPNAGGMEHYKSESNWDVWQDQNGQLWIGTAREGIKRINRRTGEVKSYRHNPDDSSTLSSNIVREIYEDSTGTLWVGTDAGLDKMNRSAETFTHYQHDPQDTTTITGGDVWSVLEDSKGNLWVGTVQGLNRMDRETGTFTRFTHNPNDSTSITDGTVGVLFEDQSGNLWLGTTNGLSRMKSETGQFKRYTYDPDRPRGISSGWVISIHERKSEPGVIWIGLDTGLDRLNTRTGTFTHFTTEDGLPSNTIYGIMEDEYGRLWLSTNRGISRFDPNTETFKNYGLASGLQALEFNSTSYHKAADGEMFFGGINGVNAFHPDRLTGNPTPPQVQLIDFNLFNQSVEPGPESPLKVPLANAKEITLLSHQNTIAFEYVGLHYRAPDENQYKYMLKGVDEEWVDAGTRRIARYTNLEPGDYTFKVKAANSDGVWSKKPASIQVTVLPPWWQTWWAYILYGLIVAAGIFAVDRIQRRRLIKKERERAREKELEQEKKHARELEEAYDELETAHEDLKAAQEQLVQQEKLASLGQLTAGIAHEIKNPLNFVNNFSDLSVELVEEAREEIKNSESSNQNSEVLDLLDDIEMNLKKINEHGDRADGIVKSMLQHSRGGDGEMEPTDLNALIEEYVNLSFHGMRASEHPINVDIELELDENMGEIPLIAEDFSRVIINLCNNAFDAMREKLETEEHYEPKLSARTKRKDDFVVIEIEDNGPGISEDVKDRILQPFYTTKEGAEGTGLGLSITNDIVKAHGGEIQIESEVNQYTRFAITLNTKSEN